MGIVSVADYKVVSDIREIKFHSDTNPRFNYLISEW